MDAPKRIWATCHTPLAQSKSGTWHEHPYGEKYILESEHARIVAEKDARIADLEGSLRVIAETEWLEVEPGGNWKPEGSEAYVEEMEAFCHWAIVFSKAALARAALKGDDNG